MKAVLSDKHGDRTFGQFARFVRLLRPEWTSLAGNIAMACGVAILALAPPYLSKILIDDIYPSGDQQLGVVVVGGILAARLAHSLLRMVHGIVDVAVGTRITNALSLALLSHVQRLPLAFFEASKIGEVQSRFEDIKDAFASVLNTTRTFAVQGVYLIVIPPVLFLLRWELAIAALLATPLAITITTLTRRRVKNYWKQATEATAEFDAFRIENLTNIRLVKTLALEGQIYEKGRVRADECTNTRTRAGGLSWAIAGANNLIKDVNGILYVALGWYFIFHQQMTLGTFLAFEMYVAMLQGPLSSFVNLHASLQQSSVQIARVFEYLDVPEEPRQSSSPAGRLSLLHRPQSGSTITLKDVWFNYNDRRSVLCGIDCTFRPGEVTSLIGSSGSGKSTILQLLLRFREPDRGNIFLNDAPLPSYPLHDLRRHLTLVTQETQLIKGTLWDNIVLARQDATVEDVEDVLGLCMLGEWVDDLPHGLATPVAEWGASLSGGQKQRIALARALLRNSPVLLLDEATANIDVTNERVILDGIIRRYSARTLVFVTHRINTAGLADRIVVLDGGKIIQDGSHHELLTNRGMYRNLLATDSDRNIISFGSGVAAGVAL
jgi:ABC-type bacteriocin/lantibiotic exporter with double-glycine peptidase domain